jgi:CRP-like cAMP-binding protein
MTEFHLFRGLSPDDQHALLSLTRRRRFARNEVVFHEGDPADALYLISKGRAAIRIETPLGDIATLRICQPGDHFGELALIDPAPRVATIIAIEPLEVRSLHVDHFNEFRRSKPTMDRVLTDALIAEVRRLSGALVEALYLPVDRRIVRRLVELVATYPPESDGRVVVPLTQEDLAQLAGTTRSTANKLLRALEDSGVVGLTRGKIDILDPERLSQMRR